VVRGRVSDFMSSEPLDLSDSGVGVECGELEVRLIDEAPAGPVSLFGLDSQSSIIRFENADVYVVTGALVGEVNALVPGLKARWLGLRFRAGGDVVDEFSGLEDFLPFRSRSLDTLGRN